MRAVSRAMPQPVRLILPSLVAVAVIAGCTDPSGASGPDLLSVGFGTGGGPCELTGEGSSFAEGVPVSVLLTMEPALPAGGTVVAELAKDGVAIPERTQTVTAEGPAPCIYGVLDQLDVGRYRATFTTTSGQMPPISGEFDVVP